ncbi:MAG TPA: nucleoside transporter C-terminal domain-containing protein [Candidatus Competibacteraceae bacterium]|nr:nucleoside transporter C-terminal domain-containing protein [Candidatus Competibacteraceae bacterium]
MTDPSSMLQSVLGLGTFIALAWLLSENRRAVPWRPVLIAIVMQVLLALLLLGLPASQQVFLALNQAVLALQRATQVGTALVFGYLGGGPLPFVETAPGGSFVLAFQALPLVVLISALSALLYHWRILPVVVRGFALVLQKALGIGGVLGIASAANVFVGMVEAPLLVRPYLASASRAELFAIMTSGMATIAGTVMALYATFLQGIVPNPVGHILTASLMSAPAAIAIALLMVPGEVGAAERKVHLPSPYLSGMDAVTQGTGQGLSLLANIIGMLMVMVALVALANMILEGLPMVGGTPLTLERIAGWLLAPLAWLLGVPWHEAGVAGALLGVKTVLNELLAYLQLSHLPAEALGERSRVLLTYAMCGFANPGSVGIMVGGLSAMAPERRGEILELGFKSLIGGTLASFMTGAVVGLLI